MNPERRELKLINRFRDPAFKSYLAEKIEFILAQPGMEDGVFMMRGGATNIIGFINLLRQEDGPPITVDDIAELVNHFKFSREFFTRDRDEDAALNRKRIEEENIPETHEGKIKQRLGWIFERLPGSGKIAQLAFIAQQNEYENVMLYLTENKKMWSQVAVVLEIPEEILFAEHYITQQEFFALANI